MANQKLVLFVCLGNICRSPMAEIIFKYKVKEKGMEEKWFSDSAGTSAEHIGDSPDPRSTATCQKRLKNIFLEHKARQLVSADFYKLIVYIFVMDEENLRRARKVRPDKSKAILELLGTHDPNGMRIVEDPYYGGQNGFDVNFDQISRSCDAFLSKNS